jgi:gamma-glutamylputrescine oxidase
MDDSVYWFAQKRPQGEPLRGTASSEVVVVGGGIAGLTCAQALAERGVDVAVVEKTFCGAGPSGKSSGFITPDSELEPSDLVANYGEAHGRELWEFASSGVERIRRTIKTLAIECDYQVQDSLFVARSNRAFRKVIEVEHHTHAALGYHSTVYDRASLGAILGSRVYQGAVRYAGTFGINAFAYCSALRSALAHQGVRIFEKTPAVRLTARGIETPAGAVDSRTVAVLTDYKLPACGLVAPVYHVQTFLSLSRPLREHEIRTIFPEERLMVWDTDLIYQYFRITGEGRLLLGGADVRSMYSPRETRSTGRVARKLYRYLFKHFPTLNLEIEHLWPGLIGVSPDFAPVVGRHEALPGVIFAGAGAGLPWGRPLDSISRRKSRKAALI